MAISPGDLLRVSFNLVGAGDEASLRSAVSRAYYAAYHHSKQWHDMLPAPGSNNGPGGGMHQMLINQLRNPASSVPLAQKVQSRQLAMKLQALRDLRTFADYKLAGTQTEREAQSHLVKARSILTGY